ncbi:MAG: arginine--tRNA ligase [Candidatus Marinimicrobia bacterium]|nr:arginine--tRNA ligase [Candidatus Neomarinimicrobiota bacterium]
MKEYLLKALSEAAGALGYSDSIADISLEKPKSSEHGDISSNLALLLAGKAKKNPMEIAQSLIDNLDLDKNKIESVNVAPPGFINFKFGVGYRTKIIERILSDNENYGRSNVGTGKTVNIEFVSANPTGPLNVGHGRNAVIGDTVSHIFEFSGYKVTREYYFNNAGRQMRILGETVKHHYLEKLGKPSEFPNDGYEGEYLIDIAQLLLDEKGDSLADSDDITPFKDIAEKTIFAEIQKTLDNIGIRMDKYSNEDEFYSSGAIEAIVNKFREENLAYDKDGAVWLKSAALGTDDDRVIIKSSGEYTYRMPDIAYHVDKIQRNYDIIIDILGADHHASFPDVVAAVGALGYDSNKIQVLLHQFVTLTKEGKKIKMSTRKANYVTLDELNSEVGTDVLRYFFLMRSVNSHLNFEIDLAKKESDENPVYYVQYAFARISSLIRLANENNINPENSNLSLLDSKEEAALIFSLGELPELILNLQQNLHIHLLTTYLSEVATLFSRFYEKHRIVSDDKDLSAARVNLCSATAIVLKNGLGLLGISAPESM